MKATLGSFDVLILDVMLPGETDSISAAS